jgi:hypothetical protein
MLNVKFIKGSQEAGNSVVLLNNVSVNFNKFIYINDFSLYTSSCQVSGYILL